jgi:hypothetical protein
VVTYPVALTNSANCPLVTSVTSIQKPSTRTRWSGFSSGRASESVLPIVNSPPGIQTMPAGLSAAIGTGCGVVGGVARTMTIPARPGAEQHDPG